MFFFFNLRLCRGFGNTSGFEVIIQDRNGGPLTNLGKVTNEFIGELYKRPEIAFAFTSFNTNNPQYLLNIDNAKAKQLNVSVANILGTMQVYFGSSFVSDFNRFGKYYRVIVEADIPYRMDPTAMDGIFVKNTGGQMVPLNELVSLERVYGPETVNRTNLFNSTTINGSVKPGYSTGDAIKAIKEVAATHLPRGYSYEWSGITREESNAGSQTQLIFILSIVFVYFLLAAQYESYILPLAVLLSIPTGLLGVFLFINLTGIENNIYVQVGIIMLIGLLAKNAILIVQYAVQRRRSGMDLIASALEAKPAASASDPDDLLCIYCRSATAYLGHWRIRIGRPFHWYRRSRRNAYGSITGCIYYSCAFCNLPGPPGKSNRKTKIHT